MKNNFTLLVFMSVSFLFASCKKEDAKTTTPITTPNQVFIKMKWNGVQTDFTGTNNLISEGTAGGSDAFSSAGFFNLSTSDNITIELMMDQDSILGSDLQSLIGVKLPVLDCIDCQPHMEMIYNVNNDFHITKENDNVFPANYFKITSVTFLATVNHGGQICDQYVVQGEFNVKLEYASTINTASNGTFKLIFIEAWD